MNSPHIDAAEAALLDGLANRLNRTGFSNADPERWHLERNEIVQEVRQLAKRKRGGAGPPDHTWRADSAPRPSRR